MHSAPFTQEPRAKSRHFSSALPEGTAIGTAGEFLGKASAADGAEKPNPGGGPGGGRGPGTTTGAGESSSEEDGDD